MAITRRVLTSNQILPPLVVALAHLVVTPRVATAASAAGGGASVQVVIPGVVSLVAYLIASVLLLGLMVARRRASV